MPAYLRPSIDPVLKLNSTLGVILILLFGIPRFILVLHANVSGSFNLVSLIFILMWITPFVLLSRQGRTKIGFQKPYNYWWLVPSFFLGLITCTLTYAIGEFLFNDTISNWYVYLSRPFEKISETLPAGASGKLMGFTISAIPAILFSPVGEEFLYRGLIQECFASRWGDVKASLMESFAFAITHLAHFGILYNQGEWLFPMIPSLLWFILMFLTSQVFYLCKLKTGSIYGAIISHMGFNLAMTYLIFYHIL